ncbi:MAG: hypothetical protein NXI30_21900 [bacterium]|nr:hypothetical protein [bacterium]
MTTLAGISGLWIGTELAVSIGAGGAISPSKSVTVPYSSTGRWSPRSRAASRSGSPPAPAFGVGDGILLLVFHFGFALFRLGCFAG